MKAYLNQEAAPWVSFAVLAGGLISALILAFLYTVEERALYLSLTPEEEKIMIESLEIKP